MTHIPKGNPRRIPGLHAARRHIFLSRRFAGLLLRDPATRPGRQRIRDVAKSLGWNRLETHAPAVDLESLAPGPVPVRLQSFHYERYNTEFFELFALAWLASALRPKRIFELGTFDGRTSLNLALNIDDDADVHTLDLPPGEETFVTRPRTEAPVPADRRYTLNHEANSKVTQLHGDSLTFDFSPYEGRMQMVFVDACHKYRHASADTETALRLVSPEAGVIVWHDYTQFRGVQRALDERLEHDHRFEGLMQIRDTSMAVLMLGRYRALQRDPGHEAGQAGETAATPSRPAAPAPRQPEVVVTARQSQVQPHSRSAPPDRS